MRNTVGLLVLLRHGQSEWNADRRFTGWQDVRLTSRGRAESADAGERLAAAGVSPDEVHTSLLTRSIESAYLALGSADRSWLPIYRTWRLNERHYGLLTGRSKEQVLSEYGEARYRLWRNSLTVAPPAMHGPQLTKLRGDPRYQQLVPDIVPATESIGDVVRRILPWWYERAVPVLRSGKNLLVVGHGNSLRALICHLDHLSQTELDECRLAVGQPVLYEFDGLIHPRVKAGRRI